MKRSKFFLMGLALTACLLMAGCSSDSSDDSEKPTPTPGLDDDTKDKGDMKMGTPEDFFVKEDSCEVKTEDCTVTLSPTVVGEKETKLTVTKAEEAPYMFSANDKMTVVDVRLEGSTSELTGVAEIRIPIVVQTGKALVACRYDEQAKEWTAVHCEYDSATGEAIIMTDKPGTYGVTTADASSTRGLTRSDGVQYGAFLIGAADTRKAYLYENEFAYVDYSNPKMSTLQKLVNHLANSSNPDVNFGDLMAKDVIDHKEFYCELGWESLKEFGFKSDVIDKYANQMGRFASAALFYQKIRALCQGKSVYTDGEKLKDIYTVAKNQVSSVLGSSALSVAMVSVAIIDYSLNKFAEEAWNGREEMYKRAYEMYYMRGEDGYRSYKAWFELIYPKFSEGMSESEVKDWVKSEVEAYCNKFWEDEGAIAYYFEQANNRAWTGGGGLNESIKKNLSAMRYSIVMNDILRPVFNCISMKMQEAQYDAMTAQMKAYAKYMNSVVTLTIKDSNVSGDENSTVGGYTVRFKNLPAQLTDKKDWGCTLDEKGNGQIQFRMFAMVNAGVKPVIEVVDGNDKVVNTIELEELGLQKNVVDVATATVTNIKSISVGGTYHYSAVVDSEGNTQKLEGGFGGMFNDKNGAKFTTKANGRALHVTGTATQKSSIYSTTSDISISFDIDDVNAIASGKAVMSNIKFEMVSNSEITSYGITMWTKAETSVSVPSLPMTDGYNQWRQTKGDGLTISDFSTKTTSWSTDEDKSVLITSPIWDSDDYVTVQVYFTE